MSLSDIMLAGGVRNLDAVHGEMVWVMSGADAGKSFTARREIAADVVIDSEIVASQIAKRTLRFSPGQPIPRLVPQDIIKTEDGKQWNATRQPQDGYLETVFDLVEIVPNVDTI